MKNILLALSLLVPVLCSAQQYQINWYKIAGGGGTVSNSQYTVNGTIGQHDAGGPLTGGSYSLTGGFWHALAVQTPGSPLLRLFLTATNTLVVAWPVSATGFRLQSNNALTTANWLNVTNPVNVVDGENQVSISPQGGNCFFRLVFP
jgi:hypothetical protein